MQRRKLLLAALIPLMLATTVQAGVKTMAHEVKEATKHTAKRTGEAAKNAAHATGHAFKTVAHDIGEKSRDGYHATKRALHKAAE